ncbi:MAG: hypothetical protein EBU88_15300, partial [Acidobacteria bacterium]|nr:hypothetical protein [Acidobacteriota bacterium]
CLEQCSTKLFIKSGTSNEEVKSKNPLIVVGAELRMNRHCWKNVDRIILSEAQPRWQHLWNETTGRACLMHVKKMQD